MINFEYTGQNKFSPAYQTTSAAAFDIHSDVSLMLEPGEIAVVQTGLRISSVEVPESADFLYFAEVRPRSGLTKSGIIVHLGTIDADYRGEIGVIIENRNKVSHLIAPGDRIAQMMIKKSYQSKSVPVNQKIRGEGGFGSTGT